jgi:transposase
VQLDYLTALLGIQGYRVIGLDRIDGAPGASAVRLHLERTRRGYICSGCGQGLLHGYDHAWQERRHLTLWQHQTILRFPRYRVDCPDCGVRAEALEFVPVRGPMVTLPLASMIYELCKVTTVKAVAAIYGLRHDTVKAIDKARLEHIQETRPLDGITVLGMDEIAVGKGHNYWVPVSALEGPRGPEMLYVVEGRSKKRLKRFWRWFGKERAAEITHAVIDMCALFEKSILAHCRKTIPTQVGDKIIEAVRVAQIIYDKFHVMRHLSNALNEVRKAELRRALGRFKKTLSGKKFVLLKRQARVRGKAREALDAILAASPKLLKAYVLKESFGRLWDFTYKGCARRFWESWKAQLKWQRMPAYRKFVKLVEGHWDGILAFCDKKVSLGYIESANLKARNVIRRAYGYRDKEYMKLKIIQACTPWIAEFQPWKVAHSIP